MELESLSTKSNHRTAGVTEAETTEIVRLSLRQVAKTEIAERVGVNRKTVARVLNRTLATLAINKDTEQARAEAIAVYRECQRTAWRAIDNGRSPAPLLDEIRQAQARIDALLGVAPLPDPMSMEVIKFSLLPRPDYPRVDADAE